MIRRRPYLLSVEISLKLVYYGLPAWSWFSLGVGNVPAHAKVPLLTNGGV